MDSTLCHLFITIVPRVDARSSLLALDHLRVAKGPLVNFVGMLGEMKFRVENALGCFDHVSGSMDVDEFL